MRPGGGKYRHDNAGGRVWLTLARHWRMPVSEIKRIVWEQRGPLDPVEEMKQRKRKQESAEFHALMKYLEHNIQFFPNRRYTAVRSYGVDAHWL